MVAFLSRCCICLALIGASGLVASPITAAGQAEVVPRVQISQAFEQAGNVLHGSAFGLAAYGNGQFGDMTVQRSNPDEVGVFTSGSPLVAWNRIDRYAWTGIWAYSLEVRGWYHSDGSSIDYYGGTASAADACGLCLWNVRDHSSSWVYARESQGIVLASGTFEHGIPTPWGTITWNTITDSVQATARP